MRKKPVIFIALGIILILTTIFLYRLEIFDEHNQDDASPVSEQVVSVPQKEYLFVEDGTDKYYIDGNAIYKNLQKDPVYQEDSDLFELCLYHDRLVYLKPLGDFTFEILTVKKDGRDQQILLDNNSLSEKTDEQVRSLSVYGEKLYIHTNYRLYSLDTRNCRMETVCEDVYTFALREGSLYYIEDAQRTFSLFKMDLESGEKELLFGTGAYQQDKATAKNLCSNFVISENGNIFYCMRLPYGLWAFDGKESRQIQMGQTFDEYSLLTYENKLYFVKEQSDISILTVYNPSDKTTTELCRLPDFAETVTIQNDCFYYKNTAGSVIKTKIDIT